LAQSSGARGPCQGCARLLLRWLPGVLAQDCTCFVALLLIGILRFLLLISAQWQRRDRVCCLS